MESSTQDFIPFFVIVLQIGNKKSEEFNKQIKFNHPVKFFGQIIWQIHIKILLLPT